MWLVRREVEAHLNLVWLPLLSICTNEVVVFLRGLDIVLLLHVLIVLMCYAVVIVVRHVGQNTLLKPARARRQVCKSISAVVLRWRQVFEATQCKH